MGNSQHLVQFDELESELDSILQEMAREFAKHDPSVRVESGDAEALAAEFSKPYADRFLKHLNSLEMGLEPADEELIRSHFSSVIDEFDTVDRAVVAKVEDQVPVEGIAALISEHRQPIMQRLQEIDEGYGG